MKWVERQDPRHEESQVHFPSAGIASRPHCSRPQLRRAAASATLPSACRTDHRWEPAPRRPSSVVPRVRAKNQRFPQYGGQRLPAARSRGLCPGPTRVPDFRRRGAQSIDSPSLRATQRGEGPVVQARTADRLAAHELFWTREPSFASTGNTGRYPFPVRCAEAHHRASASGGRRLRLRLPAHGRLPAPQTGDRALPRRGQGRALRA